MIEPRFIIAVLCGFVVGLVLVLVIVSAKARKAVEQHARDKVDAEALVVKLIGERDGAANRATSYAINLGQARHELAEANVVLDIAWVRNKRGHLERYRPQQVAA